MFSLTEAFRFNGSCYDGRLTFGCDFASIFFAEMKLALVVGSSIDKR